MALTPSPRGSIDAHAPPSPGSHRCSTDHRHPPARPRPPDHPYGTDQPNRSDQPYGEDAEDVPEGIRRFGWDRIKPGNFAAIAVLHAACVLAPAFFSWSAVAVAVVLYWAACGLGISMGYHRLLTHHGFRTSPFFRRTLCVLGTLSYQGGPLHWVGVHRLHHRDSDQEADPHSPRHGFVWAHLLWCVVNDPLGRDVTQAAKDLRKERFMVWIDRWFWLPQVVLAALLFLLGGWSWVIWGIAVRTVFAYHATWLVNSASHTWGYRNFATKDDSKNNPWVALISWGEGWHNNHHAHQRSARHGLRWFEFDPTWLTLKVLEAVGVVRNVYSAAAPSR